MEVNRLGPVMGAEIKGLNLSKPLLDSVFADIRQTWLDHDGLVMVRDQQLTPERQIAFSGKFGPLFGEADNRFTAICTRTSRRFTVSQTGSATASHRAPGQGRQLQFGVGPTGRRSGGTAGEPDYRDCGL